MKPSEARPARLPFPSEVQDLSRALSGDLDALRRSVEADPEGQLVTLHRIGAALTLRGRGADLEIPEPWRQILRRGGALHLLLGDSLEKIGQILGDASVPWAPIKGMDLRDRLYSPREERPTADLDILIARRDLLTAREALLDAGWRGEADSPRNEDFLLREGYNWKAVGPNGLLLELHFELWGSVPAGMAGAMLNRAEADPTLGSTGRRLIWSDAFLLAAAHIWVTPPPRPLLYWWELAKLASRGGEESYEEILSASQSWGLQLPTALAAQATASLFASPGCERIVAELSAELRPTERRVRDLATRCSPQRLPLSRLVLARLLARRPSRMGWRAPLRRLWAHPGVVEQHTPDAWPWAWRRLWYLLKIWRPAKAMAMGARLDKRYPG